MDYLDATCLALIQKSNRLYIDQRYCFQIKCALVPIHLQLRREFFQMLRLQSASQPNNRLSPIGLSLNPQCHLMITAIATVT
jgi:phage gp37-like protein